MLNKIFLQKLGFLPKNDASGIFYKNYQTAENYCIEVDLEEKKFNFGNKIKSESGTTLNFSQEENWVVFECIDRLLEKGYKPEDIILEKTFKVGHGASGGRLDIFVEKEGNAFLMVECKTFGKEFEKELKNISKDGGQLLTYFQNDTNAEILMLYTSQLLNNKIDFKCEIIKIEEHYRNAGKVEDIFNRWNKITSQNGIFEDWVEPYRYESKLLAKKELKPLKESDSGFIFHEFLSILRKYSVSDKPNAFNKIFNLFLAKIYDEQKRETDPLDFQWKEKTDDAVSFQIRLIDLYKKGMYEFLKKEVEGISDDDFKNETAEKIQEKKKKWLKFNKVFDIKDVVDDESFDDNQRVLKEVVELLQRYQIRYPRRQQHLSDFFERLLTTGLKQESGQFFTPPPITKFILKSLPIKQFIEQELNQPAPKLPVIIDYAAGSGHFITEAMEQYQDVINNLDTSSYFPAAAEFVKLSKIKQYDWAAKYVYGVEKDYRLVKVAKVGCYFYGDGLAQIMHGDGLDNFKSSKSYVGLLKENIDDPQKAKFSFVVSNPPYSVSAFKGDIKNDNVSNDFDLYKNLTDNSSEIECLFIERTKQLLKAGGIAALVLPSSIFSNTGIYTKAREILLKYFEVIAVTELGSGTFMATGTNTVVLFLRRRENYEWESIKNSVEKFFSNQKDVTVNGIENIFSKYVKHVWDKISFADFISLCQDKPNDILKKHDIYKSYEKKIKAKNDEEKQKIILEKEKEKLLYFILAYSQKVVVVKSGKKREEKAFLGYEFSNRRGHEGIHAIQRSKTIDECTKMFDDPENENQEKANFYIYKAFAGEADLKISPALSNHVFYANLVDMIAFDRPDFEKAISLSLKTTSKIESKREMVSLGEISDLYQPKTITSQEIKQEGKYKVYGANGVIGFYDKYNHEDSEIAITCRGATCGTVNFTEPKSWITGNAMVVKPKFSVNQKYLLNVLKNSDLSSTITGTAQPQITRTTLSPFKIPLPPKEIQEKIVKEFKKLEEKEKKNNKQVEEIKGEIIKKIDSTNASLEVIGKFVDTQYGYTANAENEGAVRYLRITDIMENSDIKENDKKFVNIDDVIFKQFSLSENDILIARSGSVGKSAIYKGKYGPMIFASYLVRLKVLDSKLLIPEFLFYFTKTKSYWEQVEELTTKGNQPNLNAEKMKLIKMPLPALNEQKKIVAQIQKIEEQISKLNEELREIKNQKTAILKKYL